MSGSGGRIALWYIVEGIGGDRAAGIAYFRALVDAHPNDFVSLVWLARLLRGGGDPSATRYAEQALILRHDEAASILPLRSVVPAPEADRGQGQVPGYPFAVYSRSGQLDPWPPQVLVIGAVGP